MNPTTLNDALAALSAGNLEISEHPSSEELIAYQAGELAADARARLREHLVWCLECAHTVTDLASWPEVELHDPDLKRTADEEADDWQAIQKRIAPAAVDNAEPAPAPIPFAQSALDVEPPSTTRPFWQPVHLLAAVLLFAVVGLFIQVARLSRQLEVPQANVFVADLEPGGGAVTRAGGSDVETRVPTGMATVVFLLVEDDLQPFDDHAAELRGEGGEILWHSSGLVRTPEGGFSIAVPLAVLPSDTVEIRLYGVAPKERELLATYRTRIARDASN